MKQDLTLKSRGLDFVQLTGGFCLQINRRIGHERTQLEY